MAQTSFGSVTLVPSSALLRLNNHDFAAKIVGTSLFWYIYIGKEVEKWLHSYWFKGTTGNRNPYNGILAWLPTVLCLLWFLSTSNFNEACWVWVCTEEAVGLKRFFHLSLRITISEQKLDLDNELAPVCEEYASHIGLGVSCLGIVLWCDQGSWTFRSSSIFVLHLVF
jgi:hypothetical protein